MKKKFCKFLWVLMAVVMLCGCSGEKTQETQKIQETPKNIPVIMPKQAYSETPIVDYSIADLPEFVDDLSQCTDPEKKYVLPDGCLYEYGSVFVPSASNQLYQATDKDGTLFHNCGYQDHARIRSVLEIGATDYSFVTGFIPAEAGDMVYFGNNCFDTQYENAHVMYTVFYDADKKVLAQVSMQKATEAFFDVVETNGQGYVAAMQINAEKAPQDLKYIRFTLIGSGEQQIISINESLKEGTEEPAWVKREQYISASWCKEIEKTVAKVNRVSLSEPDSGIRFVYVSDIHVDPDPSGSYTADMGKVCAEVMRACGIPFFATGGDNCTQSSGYAPDVFQENMEVVLDQLAPIPHKNILLAVGNHDGATGSREINGETVYYRYQLNNQQRSAVFFDWQRDSNPYKHFDSDGTYYYLDDSATKTRYIVLNSFWSEWEGDADGFVPDIQHGFMQTPIFGTQQLNWFAEKALDMPPDYGAVIITHFAPAAKDFEVFKGIVDAFNNRTTYQGSYVGVGQWQSTDISVNYKYADGEIIAVFQGHNHEDEVYDYFQSIPCINITTAGAYWAVKGEDPEERIKGTDTEFAADVVVVDRETRTIYLTRLGAGGDRIIQY